jgi:DNA-binding transcriptional LysR family regulator
MLVCRAAAPLARRPAASWADLAGEPLIRISAQTGNRILIDDALGSRRERMTWRYEAQYVATAMALVRAGLGMTVVPKFALDAEDARGLRAIALRNPGITRQIGLISKRSAALSPLAQALRRLIAQEFAARAAADRA